MYVTAWYVHGPNPYDSRGSRATILSHTPVSRNPNVFWSVCGRGPEQPHNPKQ